MDSKSSNVQVDPAESLIDELLTPLEIDAVSGGGEGTNTPSYCQYAQSGGSYTQKCQ
jgi:hypothetical protein